jgi:hypothetical protein
MRRPRCIYERFAALRGLAVERCPYQRHDDTPFCHEHLVRVAWLSLGHDPKVVRVPFRVSVVPRWMVGLLLLLAYAALCSGGTP